MNLCRSSLCLPNISKNQSAQNRYVLASGILMAIATVLLIPRVAHAAVHAAIIVDAQTGTVLYARNANARAHPASLTKLMTLFITFGQLKSGRMKLNEKLHVSSHASVQQPTKLWLQPGSEISVRAAILGITTRSANDAAVVLAEGISGSESRFARRMTRTAQKLGMTRTRFFNASGLPNARQWTTAHDMAKLAIALIDDFPGYYHFFSVRSFRFHGHIVYGHDHLLDEYPGTDGLKTGYIRSSGYNLVTSAVREKHRLVGVVLGGRTARARDRMMMALLNRGFSNLPSAELAAAEAADAEGDDGAKAVPAMVSTRVSTADSEASDAPDCVIQIGGNFSSASSVRRVLKSAIATAPGLLSQRGELVVKLRGRHYRARFRSLDADDAMRACGALHRRGFTCRIIRAPAPTNDLAGTAPPHNANAD